MQENVRHGLQRRVHRGVGDSHGLGLRRDLRGGRVVRVLKGDLSVIGPRIITRDELDQHFTDDEKDELQSVIPGITGLWQATDRKSSTFESGMRQKIELHYVRNRSFRMDWKCFTGTFGAMFGKHRTGR